MADGPHYLGRPMAATLSPTMHLVFGMRSVAQLCWFLQMVDWVK